MGFGRYPGSANCNGVIGNRTRRPPTLLKELDGPSVNVDRAQLKNISSPAPSAQLRDGSISAVSERSSGRFARVVVEQTRPRALTRADVTKISDFLRTRYLGCTPDAGWIELSGYGTVAPVKVKVFTIDQDSGTQSLKRAKLASSSPAE